VEWQDLATITGELFSANVVDRLNSLLPDFLNGEIDYQQRLYIQTTLSRYLSSGRPLSGYLGICSVMECQWTALAQILCPPLPQPPIASTSLGHGHLHQIVAAQTSNTAWATLSTQKSSPLTLAPEFVSILRLSLKAATQCFSDLLDQVHEFGQLKPEIYAYETLSESLVNRDPHSSPVYITEASSTRNWLQCVR
jgi:phosphatidylinositol 4-kinase A